MTQQEMDTPITDIGALLAKTREEKGLSLASASMQTKLSSDIIEKLESNRFQEIGAPVFARGYLSIYARFLGLNQSAFTRAFNQLSTETDTELRLEAGYVATIRKTRGEDIDAACGQLVGQVNDRSRRERRLKRMEMESV